MKIIFHIGMPKTGTTSLQHFLSRNREALLSQGIVYEPEIFHRKYHSLLPWSSTADIVPEAHHAFAHGFLQHPEDVIKLLQERITVHNKYKYYLISTEYLSVYIEYYIKHIYSHLHDCKTDVVLYIRRQDDLYESWYKQNIKDGYNVTPQHILKRWDCSYSNIISRWQKHGCSTMHVLKYIPQKTIQQFLNIYNIEHFNFEMIYIRKK